MKSLRSSLVLISLSCTVSISTNSFAGITRTFHFPPNTPVTIQNPLYWDLDAHCEISADSTKNTLAGVMVRRAGKINNIPMEQGEDTTITVHPSDDLHLELAYKAVVQITNYGDSTVLARCII